MLRGGPVEFSLQILNNAEAYAIIRPRKVGGRHHSEFQFQDDFFPHLAVFGDLRHIGGVERQVRCFELLVVAADAILIENGARRRGRTGLGVKRAAAERQAKGGQRSFTKVPQHGSFGLYKLVGPEVSPIMPNHEPVRRLVDAAWFPGRQCANSFGLADVQSRPGGHALLAADADQYRQRRQARQGMDLPRSSAKASPSQATALASCIRRSRRSSSTA